MEQHKSRWVRVSYYCFQCTTERKTFRYTVGKGKETDINKQNCSMFWHPLNATFMKKKKKLDITVIGRMVTDGWSITRKTFWSECRYHFKH